MDKLTYRQKAFIYGQNNHKCRCGKRKNQFDIFCIHNVP